jgi:ribosomal protein L19E
MPMATRRVLFDPADPADLQPDQRQREVAAILAAGVIRMREKRGAAPSRIVRTRADRAHGTASSSRRWAACTSQISPESGQSRLELPRRSSPDGQRG